MLYCHVPPFCGTALIIFSANAHSALMRVIITAMQ